MAIQLQNFEDEDKNSGKPEFVIDVDNTSLPEMSQDDSGTKEFLLCGLCRLAFTSMEACTQHMQEMHADLMTPQTSVSVGIQAGGAKRGRKKKSEMVPQMREDPMEEADVEWLPSVGLPGGPGGGGTHTTHPDGSVRRRVKPPRALTEDYVSGKKIKKAVQAPKPADNYNIHCSMMNCKAKFKTEDSLKIHLECHNLEDSGFTCKICKAKHEFWKSLRLHLWKSHQIDVDLLHCEQCKYKTDTLHRMNVHKEIHREDKPYVCYTCGKGFKQMTQMKNHQLVHTSQEGRDASGMWFASKKCDICDRTFANSKCLKKHQEAVHGGVKPYRCPYCSHTTARKAMMQLHLRTHTGEKPHKCPICPYTTGDHNSLRRHKMRHTGAKKYSCSLCPYTCIQSISLKQHMRAKHPGAGAAGVHACPRCPFKTVNAESFKNHMQDHKLGLVPDKEVAPNKPPPAPRQRSRPPIMQSLLASKRGREVGAAAPAPQGPSITMISGAASQGDNTFSMQVTMLPEGDTQVSADDLSRLAAMPSLAQAGVGALQLVYATLATLAQQPGPGAAGPVTLTQATLIGGVQASVLSTSGAPGQTLHYITYQLPPTQDPADASPAADTVSPLLQPDASQPSPIPLTSVSLNLNPADVASASAHQPAEAFVPTMTSIPENILISDNANIPPLSNSSDVSIPKMDVDTEKSDHIVEEGAQTINDVDERANLLDVELIEDLPQNSDDAQEVYLVTTNDMNEYEICKPQSPLPTVSKKSSESESSTSKLMSGSSALREMLMAGNFNFTG